MMKRLCVLPFLVTLAGASPADAQPTLTPLSAPSPLGITSPLGIGPAAQVPPVGIALGATQVTIPGVSPTVGSAIPQSAITGSSSVCGGSAAVTTATSDPSALFDGGASAGTPSGICAPTTSNANPGASASSVTATGALSPLNPTGIPLGSTELSPGGLSPAPSTSSSGASAPTTQSLN